MSVDLYRVNGVLVEGPQVDPGAPSASGEAAASTDEAAGKSEGDTPAEPRADGPTVAEYVAAGYRAANYPPMGYAARSTPEEIAAAITAQEAAGGDGGDGAGGEIKLP